MTLTAFLLVGSSVFFHAAWNFMSKKAKCDAGYYLIANATASLMWVWFAPASGIPWTDLPAKFWIFFLVSAIGETLYTIGLAYGYRHCDISVIYPAGRSLPVITVTFFSVLFHFGKMPTGIAAVGMLVITAGALLLPQKSLKGFSLRQYLNRNLIFIVMITTGTTLYTIFDSEATKLLAQYKNISPAMRGMAYNFLVQFGLVITLAVFFFFDKKEHGDFKRHLHSVYPYLTGIFSSSAYVLILFAMPLVSNVGYIQAFRQMSLPLGALAGFLLLKEKASPLKITGILMIMTGLLMTLF